MKHLCEHCSSSFSLLGNLTSHLKKKHGISKNNTCECGEYFEKSQSLNAHYRWCLIHRDGKLAIPSPNKGKSSPFRGCTYEETLGVEGAKLAKAKLSAAKIGKVHSVETREKLSASRNKILEEGRGFSYGLKGRYDDIWFDSSWELAYYLFLKETKGILLIRNWNTYFDYEDGTGRIRRTRPDFIHPNGTFIEIKGYPNVFTKFKYAALKDKIIFLFHDGVKESLNYCKKKYGVRFTDTLYQV